MSTVTEWTLPIDVLQSVYRTVCAVEFPSHTLAPDRVHVDIGSDPGQHIERVVIRSGIDNDDTEWVTSCAQDETLTVTMLVVSAIRPTVDGSSDATMALLDRGRQLVECIQRAFRDADTGRALIPDDIAHGMLSDHGHSHGVPRTRGVYSLVTSSQPGVTVGEDGYRQFQCLVTLKFRARV